KANGFQALALGDLRPYCKPQNPPQAERPIERYPQRSSVYVDLPIEVAATRADLPFWLEKMIRHHRYDWAEAAAVCGLSELEVREQASKLNLDPVPAPLNETRIRVLPYPGGRNPRIGF